MGIMDLLWPVAFPVLAIIVAAIHNRISEARGAEAAVILLMGQIVHNVVAGISGSDPHMMQAEPAGFSGRSHAGRLRA